MASRSAARVAVTAAHQHGVYRTAQALHLDYGGLKAHLERADGRRDAGRPTFVEVAGSTLTETVEGFR